MIISHKNLLRHIFQSEKKKSFGEEKSFKKKKCGL